MNNILEALIALRDLPPPSKPLYVTRDEFNALRAAIPVKWDSDTPHLHMQGIEVRIGMED